MKFRHATPEDWPTILEMHGKMGIDYELPAQGKFCSSVVFEDDAGQVRMAILLRPTVEAYMIVDRNEKIDPREQWSRFVVLHRASEKDAIAKGYDDVYACPPPELQRSFGKRLSKLGWFRPWGAWNRLLKGSA
jgi:hypothetical protein